MNVQKAIVCSNPGDRRRHDPADGNAHVGHDDWVALRCAKGDVTLMTLVNRCASVQVEDIFAEHARSLAGSPRKVNDMLCSTQ
jgi:hypothetical protein